MHVRWLFPWALACFAAIWVLALWRDLPRGLSQKAVIALIVGWLGAVALLLQRRARLRPRQAGDGRQAPAWLAQRPPSGRGRAPSSWP
ncbi:hypothetical protein [Luteimonas viscosa]|uniref:hypothetical protein n=1 Tax=Luteimonas viscosa TaxID=1132694 RepID=UPI0021CCEE77|nr:hypothetical protein [Luteimonas viscosa]